MRAGLLAGVSAVAWLAAFSPLYAADLVPVIAPPVVSWNGLYVGAHIGSGWGQDNWRTADGFLADPVFMPFLGEGASGGTLTGGQIGYNVQLGRWVLGLEVDASRTDLAGTAPCGDNTFICTSRIDSLGTITPRFGIAFDEFLLYGKIGAAWAHEKLEMTPYPTLSPSIFEGRRIRWGTTVGAGLEYAFTPALSAKMEYDFIELAGSTFALADQFADGANVLVSTHAHLVKLGLNYRLDDHRLDQTLPAFAATGGVPFFAFAPAPRSDRDWTGFYVGAHAGGGFGRTDWKSADGVFLGFADLAFAGSGPAEGLLAGGQIGFNRQLGRWVVGGEAELSWGDLDGYAKCGVSTLLDSSFNCHTHVKSLGTLTARVGQTYGDLLIYAKGGAAWMREDHEAGNPAIAFGAPPANDFFASDTRWGYVLGAGFEYAFSPAWSAKVEYDYRNFGSRTVAFTDQLGNVSNVDLAQDLHVIKMGLNYRLGTDAFAPAYASAAPVATALKAPQLPAGWTIEAGTRAWGSSGRKGQDLYSFPGQNLLVSRLIYTDMTGLAVEGFARFDHRDGLFVKGNFGLGDLTRGQFNDEDFPPGLSPYSNTSSIERDGRMRYGGLDLGYDLISGPGGMLGPYVGYRYFYESGLAFGCAQIATNPSICAAPFQPTNLLAITETETWRGVAVGLNARVPLGDRWRLEIDAAYLPYLDMQGVDQHWNRPDINPGPEHGFGWGAQAEAIVTYALSDRWRVGVGGRYSYLTTAGAYSVFPALAQIQLQRFYTERYGGFLQASYTFGGTGEAYASARPTDPGAATRDWTGVYAGGHLGAGRGHNDWADPFPPPVFGDRVDMGGAIAGAQAGINLQLGRFVYGAEAAGSWASLEGALTCFAGIADQTQAGLDCGGQLRALVTLTGRVGVAADRTLYYVKAGPAFGHSSFALNASGIANGNAGLLVAGSADKWGWTAGAGIEHALTDRWSVVGEYEYVDLGSASVTFGSSLPAIVAPVQTESISQRYHVMTLGVNYKLDANPFAR
jgi:opacity protein-like surface antigen